MELDEQKSWKEVDTAVLMQMQQEREQSSKGEVG